MSNLSKEDRRDIIITIGITAAAAVVAFLNFLASPIYMTVDGDGFLNFSVAKPRNDIRAESYVARNAWFNPKKEAYEEEDTFYVVEQAAKNGQRKIAGVTSRLEKIESNYVYSNNALRGECYSFIELMRGDMCVLEADGLRAYRISKEKNSEMYDALKTSLQKHKDIEKFSDVQNGKQTDARSCK